MSTIDNAELAKLIEDVLNEHVYENDNCEIVFHDGTKKCDPVEAAAKAIAVKLSALRAQEGWRLVPVEPTPEMVGAWYRVKNGHHFHDEAPPTDRSDYAAYRAMIAAAPQEAGR